MYLSKSDFILGNYCQKSLWLKKHKKELLVSLDKKGFAVIYKTQI